MLKVNESEVKTYDVGVIVGRFQCHVLHDAHKELIQSVLNQHNRVIIFLGLSHVLNTERNPLDFRTRRKMIEETYPNIEVYYIEDCPDDNIWSKNLDRQIKKWVVNQSVRLYGSRDSFLPHYKGMYPTHELESKSFVSATEVRKKITTSYPPSIDFRAGIIAASGMRYPTAFQTVDVIVENASTQEILLVKKPNESKFRIVGGFSDPKSESLEADARREVIEETGVEISQPKYIGSTLIDDWRYRNERDKIKTALFVSNYIFGVPQGSDDVELAKWFTIKEIKNDLNINVKESGLIVTEHIPLMKMYLEYKEKQPQVKDKA